MQSCAWGCYSDGGTRGVTLWGLPLWVLLESLDTSTLRCPPYLIAIYPLAGIPESSESMFN